MRTRLVTAAAIVMTGTAAPLLRAQDNQQHDQIIAIEEAIEQAKAGATNGPVPVRIKIVQNHVKKEKAAFLGVVTTPVSPAVREQLKLKKGVGLVVEDIDKDSPAEQAGIKQYDVLQQIDDQWLINTNQLAVVVRMHQSGEEVKVSLIRQGQLMTVTAKLVEKELPALDGTNAMGVPVNEPFGDPFVVPDGSMILRGPMKANVDDLLREMRGNTMTLSMNDDEHTLTLSVRDGHKHLTAVDRDGNVIFNGPVDTDEQRSAIPATLRAKLDRLESKPGTIRMRMEKPVTTSTRPGANP